MLFAVPCTSRFYRTPYSRQKIESQETRVHAQKPENAVQEFHLSTKRIRGKGKGNVIFAIPPLTVHKNENFFASILKFVLFHS
jgi:hypothetical protein